MKRGTTSFLKLAIILIGLPVLGLCIFGLPVIMEAAEYQQELTNFLYPVIIVMYVAAMPFFVALYQALRLLNYIDKNKAFSELSVRVLRNIKYCAFIISVLYMVGMPFFYLIGEIDDAPGVILIGLILIFAPIVIAVFAAVLENLLKEAIDIKSDNDLTI